MRILNQDALTSHGNVAGRKAMVQILEAGLQAADPYTNTLKLLRIENGTLIVGNPDFEPTGSPQTADEIFDLSRLGRIFVFGAGKGVQRVAKAIEDVLGDRLTGGHVIAKHGDAVILKRIGVTHGGHPVPDEGCAEGCRHILELCKGLTSHDLVFTIGCNGISALLTLPVPGVTMEDVRQVTYMMQIEHGAPTSDLNAVRNHLDMMKSGRVSRCIQPATAIHIMAIDPATWQWVMYRNVWQHFLPDCTTFADAVAMLKKWDCWDRAPASVRDHLLRADPAGETIKADEFLGWRFRVFGTMPHHLSMIPTAEKKAAELGFTPYKLSQRINAEASQAGLVIADIALNIERQGEPFAPPCALFSSGELLVTVGEEDGVGGRNQEYALSAARRLAGSEHIVMGGVDTDGTDGPGGYIAGAGDIRCLAGGIVDGYTAGEAKAQGVDMLAAIRRHSTSAALWALKSGVVAEHNISIGDLDVTLITGRSEQQSE